MTRAEIRRKFDEIVAFSGLEEFIDTPVKRYSSGMFARLGFSVAAHLDPEILVIDEVLSVGDYVFQRKGLDKMREVARSGVTVLFVSHNLRAVADLCGRCLLLDRGRLIHDGPTDDTIRAYLNRGAAGPTADAEVYVTGTRIRAAGGDEVRFTSGTPVEVVVTLAARADVPELAVVLEVQDEGCYNVFNTSTERLGRAPLSLKAGETASCTFDLTLHLAPGSYHVAVYLYRYSAQHLYHRAFPAVTFFVESDTDVRGVANLYPSLRDLSVARSTSPARAEPDGQQGA
jgi:lipopolysaccharide transport system ATP-binding protein